MCIQAAACHSGDTDPSVMGIVLQSKGDSNNYYATFVQRQNTALIPSFTLDSGVILRSVPVAYSTWGRLNETRDNVLVICHALTGSSDAVDWWRPLIGPGKALDHSRYFIFCANVLGSPYGSASPLSMNPETGRPYGPSFPDTTVRDDVRIHKLVLDALGVRSIAAVIGGSMGGMTTLEWPLCTPQGYVKNIIPITTSAYHGAWGISWGETQRQAIYSDTTFNNGWYEPVPNGQPRRGLGTARMIAMLTYRSHGSFESRFSRKPATAKKAVAETHGPPTPPSSPGRNVSERREMEYTSTPIIFSTQSYMQYQADKFLKRFDANCYIHLTKKMDSHDVTYGRLPSSSESTYPPSEDHLRSTLSLVPPKALVVSVETDVLFTPEQQLELARCLPEAKFVALDSPDGHDGFLLEFETLNKLIRDHLKERYPLIYTGTMGGHEDVKIDEVVNSIFGEAEAIEF